MCFIVTTVTENIHESYFQTLIFHIHAAEPLGTVLTLRCSHLCSRTELCWLLDLQRQNN